MLIVMLLTICGETAAGSVSRGTLQALTPAPEFPQRNRVIVNENMILLVFRTGDSRSGDLVVYAPWDSLFPLDLSTSARRMRATEHVRTALPGRLILETATLHLAQYHQGMMTCTDSFPFAAQIGAADFIGTETTTVVKQALRERTAAMAALQISGWLPRIYNCSSFTCAGKFAVVPVPLRPGLNLVRYGWLSPGFRNPALADSLEVFYRIAVDGDHVPAGFDTVTFHGSASEQRCAPCHAVPAGRQAPASERSSCLTCHRGMMEQRSVHGPIASQDCDKCHKTDPGSGYALLHSPADERKACVACHRDVLERSDGNTVVHGPFGGGRCNDCHSAHASAHRYQLRKSVHDLCNSCHADKHDHNHPVVSHPVGWKPDPRDPDRALSCISCHEPHTSAYPNLLATADGYFALCQECHRK